MSEISAACKAQNFHGDSSLETFDFSIKKFGKLTFFSQNFVLQGQKFHTAVETIKAA